MGLSAGRRYAFGHPLAMNSFRHWLRVWRWGGRVDPAYWPRALAVTLLSPLSAEARWRERLMYGAAVDAVEIKHAPVFVIGHWRSGTTHLHNLLSRDPQFGFVTTYQSQAPKAFLAGRWSMRPIMAALMPRRRPMDNVALGTDEPQEEEWCLCNSSMHSFYRYSFFPRRDNGALAWKYLLMEGLSDDEFEEWRREYIELVKKATLHMGGKRLVLKNPCNTGRTDAVQRVFPGAKFICIYRNPYDVYTSTLHLRRTFQKLVSFQRLDPEQSKRDTLEHYRLMMGRYLEAREQMPPGVLAEVRYEELEARPLEVLRRVYEELGLPCWDAAQRAIAKYLASIQGYEKNRYTLGGADVAMVNEQWGFAFEKLGYEMK